ncbi:MAG: hypothetical protein AABX23_02195 [Nanoarchaeota archaeon]
MEDQERLQVQTTRNWKTLENKVGKDPKDFIPLYGLWNYGIRAWPIIKQTRNQDYQGFHFGYMDKVMLGQFVTSTGVAIAYVINSLFN